MIQAWKDLRFSAKLTLIFFLVLSLTIGVITIRQSYSSFRFLEEKSLEDMENLAEQVILNFTQTLEDIEQLARSDTSKSFKRSFATPVRCRKI